MLGEFKCDQLFVKKTKLAKSESPLMNKFPTNYVQGVISKNNKRKQ